DRIGRDRLARRRPRRLLFQVHARGEGPIILSRRLAVALEATVLDAELAGLAGEPFGEQREKPCTHFSTSLAQGHAAELHRLAAGGETLVRGACGVAGFDGDALWRDVELLRRELAHRGE